MAIQVQGLTSTGGNLLDVYTGGLVPIQEGFPTWSLSGGSYTVAGQLSAVVAAGLASNTSLMSMRFSTTSKKLAYITRMRVLFAAGTFGAVATTPGAIALQRFSAATPSGGTARTPNKQIEGLGEAGSDMTDIRDNNAALTVTSVAFGTIVSANIVPLFLTGGTSYSEWLLEPDYPIILAPGDGLVLRTQSAMPATQTWVFSYTFHWYEK